MKTPDAAETAAPQAGARGYRFALVVSQFNARLTKALQEAARAALLDAGATPADLEVFAVPGAFELPQAARAVAETGRVDAVICLGCVIRGGTPHFEYISSAVAHGIMQAAGETGLPIAFGVLTTDTLAQAEERAAPGPDNKGREAAVAAIEMAALYRRLGRPPARAGQSRPFGFEPPGRPGDESRTGS